VKGVVFDFDGPIFPGRKAAVAALNATHDQFAEAVGRPRQSMATAPLYPPSCMIDAAYAEFDLPRDRLSEIRAYYTEQVRLAERALAVEAAVVRLLDGLLARGCRLAVLTSRDKTNVTELLKHLGLSNRFRLVVGSDGDPTRKLDPAMFPTIAEQLGLDVADLVLVGDSDTDCKAAQIAGVPYYHVAWSGEPTSEAHVRATAVANSVGDLEAIFSDNKPLETYLPTVLPSQLVEAIQAEAVSFFAGAGASVPSGIGGWADHYLPLLRKLGAGSLLGEAYPLPEILQLLCASPQDESRIFDGFRDSFRMMSGKRANAYHYAMLKSHTRTIWTTNYDLLFEQAVLGHSFEHIVVKTDDELLNNFSARSLIIKLNGDFEGAKFRPDLEWDMVFVEEQFDTAEVSRREIWRLFEDHYRNKLIVFVGVSFRDPALRRILSVAAKAIPRSRTMAGKSASFVTPLRTLALRHTGKAHALTEAFACSKVSRVVAWLSGAQATDGEA
jgi:phosphoglycolate phosphatase-like HAD superfamily hydrolase